jgi:hypothetical protein
LDENGETDPKNNIVFDQQLADRILSRFVGPSTVSLRQAASPEFAKFCTYLNPDYKLPSRQTIANNIFAESKQVEKLIQKFLNEAPIVS